MKEFKGTKGEFKAVFNGLFWEVQSSLYGEQSMAILSDNKHMETDIAMAEANARLFVAAPDLLKVLQLILNYHDDVNCKLHREDVDMARAAINKALGEEK